MDTLHHLGNGNGALKEETAVPPAGSEELSEMDRGIVQRAVQDARHVLSGIGMSGDDQEMENVAGRVLLQDRRHTVATLANAVIAALMGAIGSSSR